MAWRRLRLTALYSPNRQGRVVRHIRVIQTADGKAVCFVCYLFLIRFNMAPHFLGYTLSAEDPSLPTVWELIKRHRNVTLANNFASADTVRLRYPLIPEQKAIAPDLLQNAGEAGMSPADFDDDVAAFLEGGVGV